MKIAVYVFNPSHIFLMAKSLLIDTPDTGVKQRPIAIIWGNTQCGFKYFRTWTPGIKLFRNAWSFESNGSSDVRVHERLKYLTQFQLKWALQMYLKGWDFPLKTTIDNWMVHWHLTIKGSVIITVSIIYYNNLTYTSKLLPFNEQQVTSSSKA